MVYVLSVDGKPLMPTTPAKARILLKQKKAIVKTVKPFTIQLTYKTKTEYIQPITLGVDSGYLNIGFSAITNKKELASGEVKLLQGIKERLHERSTYRKIRRQRLRYRKARWNNRVSTKKEGWLAPSIQHKNELKEKNIYMCKLKNNVYKEKINFVFADKKIKNVLK